MFGTFRIVLPQVRADQVVVRVKSRPADHPEPVTNAGRQRTAALLLLLPLLLSSHPQTHT